MAGSRRAGPIGGNGEQMNVLDGTTCTAPSPRPGPAGFSEQRSTLCDIGSRFIFRQWNNGRYFYKEASGELGVPRQVTTHRDVKEQRTLSEGTGEHAGHLIGIQFGAPGDLRNLGLQNANINTHAPKEYHEAFVGPGGSYYQLESTWKELLQNGWKIHVTVTDKYQDGENRPFTRSVRWTEISPAGSSTSNAVDYGNFGSPQKRAADTPREANPPVGT